LPLKAQGEFALVKQNLEHALGKAGQPVNFGTMAHDHEVYMILTDTAVELHDADAIRKYAPELERVAARDGHRLYLAIAQRARGAAHLLSGEHAAAENDFKEALGLFMKLGARWQIGRTLYELGELYLAQSKEKAREYFSQALGAFEAIQAAPDMERTHATLDSLE
jgi:tetratricopeptide (TPR) repeat protein